MPYALCPMPYALCPMPYAMAMPMPVAVAVTMAGYANYTFLVCILINNFMYWDRLVR